MERVCVKFSTRDGMTSSVCTREMKNSNNLNDALGTFSIIIYILYL